MKKILIAVTLVLAYATTAEAGPIARMWERMQQRREERQQQRHGEYQQTTTPACPCQGGACQQPAAPCAPATTTPTPKIPPAPAPTTSKPTKAEIAAQLMQMFPGKLHTLPNLNRCSGVDAVAEMLILGQAKQLYVSVGSTYPEVGWWLGDCKAQVTVVDWPSSVCSRPTPWP